MPAPDFSDIGRPSGLAVGQALLDHLANINLLNQVIPRRILRHPIHQLVRFIFSHRFRHNILQ